MTRVKDATFESNVITGSDAFTTSTGSPTVAAGSLIKGTYAARTNWTGSTNVSGTITGIAAGEWWSSFYIRVAAYPASTARIFSTTNGSTQLNFTMTSAGLLAVRQNTTGLGTLATLSLNTTYRIGVHVKIASNIAVSDAVADVYITAAGSPDAAFGAATISNAALTMNASNNVFTNAVWGHSNGAAATGDIYWDNVRLDTVSMPTDDVAGGSDTPKAVSVTSTIVPTVDKGTVILKAISATVTATGTVLKNVGKAISNTVATVISRNINQPKTVIVSLVAIITKQRDVGKPISLVVSTVVSGPKTLYNLASVTIGNSLSILKDILKPVSTVASITVSLSPKEIAKTISKSIVISLTEIHGNLYLIAADITVTINIISQNILDKLIAVVSNTTISMQRSIAFTKTVVSTVIGIFTKILATESEFAQMNRNVRTITLHATDTVLGVLGINRRSITFKDKENDNS